jgi:hypothetical protein
MLADLNAGQTGQFNCLFILPNSNSLFLIINTYYHFIVLIYFAK